MEHIFTGENTRQASDGVIFDSRETILYKEMGSGLSRRAQARFITTRNPVIRRTSRIF